MNPLTKFLRTLRRPSTAWHIIIDPNPREHLGFQVLCLLISTNTRSSLISITKKPIAQPGVYKFTLNLFRGVYLDRYIQDFPSCAWVTFIWSVTSLSDIQLVVVPPISRFVYLQSPYVSDHTIPIPLVQVIQKFARQNPNGSASSTQIWKTKKENQFQTS